MEMEKELRIGDWVAQPSQSRLVRADDAGRRVSVDAKAMQVLLCLAQRAGEVVGKEQILETVWEGAFVTDEVLPNAIWSLRKALGDDARSPRYIQTVPRKGYRLIAPVKGRASPSWPPHRLVLGLSAILAGVALAMGWVARNSGTPPLEPSSAEVVAVFPFDVRGSEEFDYLHEGMADLLATTLNTESQKTVDPTTLLRALARDGSVDLDRDRAREVALRFGANRYVLGSVVETGGRLRVQATLHGASADAEALARANAEGSTDQLFSLVDELTTELLVPLVPGPIYEVDSSRTTDSLEALKAFLEGEKAVRSTPKEEGYRKAFQHFRLAVELDPDFALAWSRLAHVAAEYWEREPASQFMERALELRERLSERERLKLEGGYHYINARADEAATVFEELVRKYPDDAFGLFILANNRSYFDWRRGRFWKDSVERQVQYLEHAYELDPLEGDLTGWLGLNYFRAGRLEDAERVHKRLHGANAPLPLYLAEFRALESDDPLAWKSFLTDLRDAETNDVHHAFRWAAAHPEHVARAREAARLLLDPEKRSVVERATGRIFLAVLATARGRWREAKSELAAAESLYPAAAREFEAILSLSPFLQVPREDWESVRDKLGAWDPARERPAEGRFAISKDFHVLLRPYLLGLLNARLGDREAALGYATELVELDGPASAPELNGDLSRSVRAHLALESGEPAEALSLLEQARMDVHPERWHSLEMRFAWQFHERLLRAELLHQRGRSNEALGWWPVGPARGSSWTLPFADLRVSEVFERQHRTGEAIDHLSRFIEFWKDCDPELRSVVEDAERRLERLKRQDETG